MMIPTLWTSLAIGQTTCEAPRVCATPRLLEDSAQKKADNLCGKVLKKVERVDEYRLAAASAQAREFRCWGRLEQSQKTPPPAERGAPLWLRISLDVAAVGLAAFTGATWSADAPDALKWSAATAAVGAFGVRIALELF